MKHITNHGMKHLSKIPRLKNGLIQDCWMEILKSCHMSFACLSPNIENIARVQNCPDITISNFPFGLCLLAFLYSCLFNCFVFLSFCLLVFFVFLYLVLLPFCLFVNSRHHSDQILKDVKSQKPIFVSKF